MRFLRFKNFLLLRMIQVILLSCDENCIPACWLKLPFKGIRRYGELGSIYCVWTGRICMFIDVYSTFFIRSTLAVPKASAAYADRSPVGQNERVAKSWQGVRFFRTGATYLRRLEERRGNAWKITSTFPKFELFCFVVCTMILELVAPGDNTPSADRLLTRTIFVRRTILRSTCWTTLWTFWIGRACTSCRNVSEY